MHQGWFQREEGCHRMRNVGGLSMLGVPQANSQQGTCGFGPIAQRSCQHTDRLSRTPRALVNPATIAMSYWVSNSQAMTLTCGNHERIVAHLSLGLQCVDIC